MKSPWAPPGCNPTFHILLALDVNCTVAPGLYVRWWRAHIWSVLKQLPFICSHFSRFQFSMFAQRSFSYAMIIFGSTVTLSIHKSETYMYIQFSYYKIVRSINVPGEVRRYFSRNIFLKSKQFFYFKRNTMRLNDQIFNSRVSRPYSFEIHRVLYIP